MSTTPKSGFAWVGDGGSNSSSRAPAGPMVGDDGQPLHSCFQRNWPLVFLAVSSGGCVAGFVALLLDFINPLTLAQPWRIILNLYLILFVLLIWSAELRYFRFVRRVVYLWLQHVYFLTKYIGRGLAYIFIGSLFYGAGLFGSIIGCVLAGLGVAMIVVALVVDLPTYVDGWEMQRQHESEQAAVSQQAHTAALHSGQAMFAPTEAL